MTKIHAWLLIPLVLGWSVVRLGPRRGLLGFAVWGATGFALFVAGWPWLWPDPWHRLAAYLGTGVERSTIVTTYFGRVYADRDVPWHYPWLYFAATVPVGVHLLSLAGAAESVRRRHDGDRFPVLIGLSVVGLLAVFSTRVPVYDGERLFLMAFPLWAVFAGRGFGALWDRLPEGRWPRAGLALFLLAQGYGVVTLHPFQLSYYNALVGGLPGAERLGLELTYWGDAVDPALLDRLVREVPEGEPVALAPTLYPGQGRVFTTRAMARRSLVLGDEDAVRGARWAVIFRRTAYWKPDLRGWLGHARRVAVRSRQGVWLAALYERKDSPAPVTGSSPKTPTSP